MVRYLFDSLPDCRRQRPWAPTFPNGINWNNIPQQWRIYPDGVIFDAIEGTNPIKVFEVFFDYGMSADHNLERAISPLACAIQYSNYEFAEFLLQKGANPNGLYMRGEDTFLSCAACSSTPDMLNLLVQHGARLRGSQALRQAAQCCRVNNAKRLLELGVDINEVFTRYDYSSIPSRKVNCGCALHFAIKGRQLHKPITDSPTEMVRFLLEQGAQADILDGDGKTPLQVARKARKRDIIQVFQEYGVIK